MTKGQIKQKQDTIDWQLFEDLCEKHNTRDDICYLLRVSKDTLLRAIHRRYDTDFETVYKRFSAVGRKSLRKAQYELALSGNPTMLIWLGKQNLNQTDKQHVSLERIEPLVIETSREQIKLDLVSKEIEDKEVNLLEDK